ncbi:MAG TPA: thiamine pyrophosphate-dependent enzyme [Acetobacteraceae bacterium]|nr:thiamine pyrophosphate-dependent enzyme [Acetobacteraceae bacterium]
MTATQRMTTGEATVASLAANGIDTLFCLPGVQNDYLFDALHKAQDRIRAIHTRHEQGAAYMALGAAMASGRPTAYAVVPGPGFLNTTAALCTAYAVNAPVLALVGQIPAAMIGRGYGQLHEIPDQLAVMRGLTKWADRIRAPHEAPAKITEAFRQMQSGRRRPAAIECAIDVWSRAAPVALQPAAKPEQIPVDTDAAARAAKLLGEANRPLIVVGGGAQDASAEVTALAEMLQAPVVAHRMGQGVVDRRNPLAVNTLAGWRLWEHADVVLAVGTRLSTQLLQWGTDEQLKVIRIDADPEEIDRISRPALGIVGDAAPVLRAVLESVPAHNRRRESRRDELLGLHAEVAKQLAFLQPQIGYLDAIRAELPENGIFVDELTQLGYVGRMTFPAYRPRTFLSPGYQGTLGWGVATALGVKAARPDTPVVAVSGDGGFMFTAQELATAVQFHIPVVIVLVNDGAYGNVRRIQVDQFGNRLIGSDLRNPDFQKFVESFGAMALRATSPESLRVALREAFRADVPAVIEVPAGPMPDPWSVTRPPRNRPRKS